MIDFQSPWVLRGDLIPWAIYEQFWPVDRFFNVGFGIKVLIVQEVRDVIGGGRQDD